MDLHRAIELLPIGPYEVRPSTDSRYNWDLYFGSRLVGQVILTFPDLGVQDRLVYREHLAEMVKNGGGLLRWVSSVRTPEAFPEETYLSDATRIVDPSSGDLKQEFVRVPGDRAYIGELYREAIRLREESERAREQAVHLAKIEVDEAFAEARLQALIKLKGDPYNIAKPTEKQIEDMVILDPSVKTARRQSLDKIRVARKNQADAEDWERKFKGILDALDKKEKMLSMLGAHIRHEFSPGPRIRESEE